MHTAHATREVVLSGGAINSPQLLMLSGIGPADHLREVGVDVVHDLPGVGGGLQDHPLVPMVYNVRSGRSLRLAETPLNLAKWKAARARPADLQPRRGGLFTRSSPELAEPDLQYHFLPVKFWKQAEIDPDVEAFSTLVVLVHVHSRGSVRLRSADPTWSPAIDAGYLTDERDLDALVSGVEKAREIAATGPLASVLADEWSPGGTVHGRDALRASVRNTLESLYHPVSSCRMGTDEQAVVDAQLRVRGIDGPAGGRRLGDADAGARQHQRADDHDRRAGGGPDPGPQRRPGPRRRGLTSPASFRYRKLRRGARLSVPKAGVGRARRSVGRPGPRGMLAGRDRHRRDQEQPWPAHRRRSSSTTRPSSSPGTSRGSSRTTPTTP